MSGSVCTTEGAQFGTNPLRTFRTFDVDWKFKIQRKGLMMNGVALKDFFLEKGNDDQGRPFVLIINKSDEWLESTHNYIQWLFPLAEKSGANPTAPLIDVNVVSLFQFNATAQKNYLLGLDRMLSFYGLKRHDRSISKDENWNYRKGFWFESPTHNDLRITRMLKSMAILGFGEYAQALLNALLQLSNEPDCGFSSEAIEFWKSAVQTKWIPKEPSHDVPEYSEANKEELQESINALWISVKKLSESDTLDENEKFRWEHVRFSVAKIAWQAGAIGKTEYGEEVGRMVARFANAIGGVHITVFPS